MTCLEANSIWGIPMVLPPTKILTGFAKGGDIVSIKRQLHTFLAGQIEKWQPELMVVVERKGTAILRALKEWKEEPLDWSWKEVISSSVIDQKPDEYFCGKRILIFDEMMKTGAHLRKILEYFHDRGIWSPSDNKFHVAVFAVHEESSEGLQIKSGEYIDYDWFYHDLTSLAYHCIRIQIVNMLQESGSLMLDTEHIEVRVRPNCNFNQFVQAISRKAKSVVFHSSDQRTNITVLYEDDDIHQLPPEHFPEGTCLKNIVKKCRFVQRKSNEFAIIPICYPSILKGTKEWTQEKEVAGFLGNSVAVNEKGKFYGVALIAALEVLKWVLKDLAVAGSENYSISLPKDPKEVDSTGGYSLDHLLVMYPTLDIGELVQKISRIEKEARSDGTRLKGRKFQPYGSLLIRDDELRQSAISLVQVIRQILDQRSQEYQEYCQTESPHPFGLRSREIFNLGRKLDWDDNRISALFDILIDEAHLVTHVQDVQDEDGESRLARTFEPDGEMASELIRRYTNQWGLPDGF